MHKIAWSDEYCTGVEQIDHQHKKLVDMINLLSMAITYGKDKDAIGRILDTLMEYTRYHFLEEERLMLALEFEGYSQHRRNHSALIEQLSGLVYRWNQDRDVECDAIVSFLKKWLLDHIQTEDIKIAEAEASIAVSETPSVG